MKTLVFVSVLCLGVGVGLIFYFCNGTTGFSFGYPFSGSSLHLDVTTTGPAAVGGVALTALGSLLLVIAWIVSLVGLFRRADAPLKRREEPFQE